MSSYAQFFRVKKDDFQTIHPQYSKHTLASSLTHRQHDNLSNTSTTTSTSNIQSRLVCFEESHYDPIVNNDFERPGTLMSLIIFQSNNNDSVKEEETYAYICKRCYSNSPTRKQSFYSESKIYVNQRSLLTKNNEVHVIKFDGSAKIPLSNLGSYNSNDDDHGEEDIIFQTKVNSAMDKLSRKLGSAVKCKPFKYIIDVDPYIQSLNNHHKKNLKERYCWVTDRDINNNISKNDILGIVVSVSISESTPNNIQPEISLVPIPLLSISMSRINTSTKKSNHDNYSSSDVTQDYDQQIILLMQCLKRQLVGMLIVHHDTGSIIGLHAPNIRGKNELFYFQINEVLPFHKSNNGVSSYITQSHQSYLYQILPSTRITLDMTGLDPNESESNELMSNSVQSPCENDRPHHEDILVNTIKAIRLCSRKYQSSKINEDENFYSLDIPRVFLLSGSPGVGKTYSVRKAVEASNNVGPTKLISIRGSELLSTGNESDAAHELTKMFNSASSYTSKREGSISVIFMDECDALFTSIIVSATLASFLDQMSSNLGHKFETGWKRILVVAATNRIDAVPAMLRRPGRFDREICISPPDTNQRFNILKNLCNDFDSSIIRGKVVTRSDDSDQQLVSSICEDEELVAVSELCVGYVASDLAALVRKAVLLAMNEKNPKATLATFKLAMKEVGASALRDSAISAPPATRWDDIAGDAGGAKVCYKTSRYDSFIKYHDIFSPFETLHS